MKKIVVALLLSLLLAFPAMAGTDHDICFSALDENMDGEMSSAEFNAVFPGDEAVFKAADADGSGSVSHDEWEEYKESQGFEEPHGDS